MVNGNGSVNIVIQNVSRATWDNALSFLVTQVNNFNTANTGSAAALHSQYNEVT